VLSSAQDTGLDSKFMQQSTWMSLLYSHLADAWDATATFRGRMLRKLNSSTHASDCLRVAMSPELGLTYTSTPSLPFSYPFPFQTHGMPRMRCFPGRLG